MRLFAALTLPQPTRFALSLIQGGAPGARWTAEANFHVTLSFFGEIDPHAAEALHAALCEVRAASFEFNLRGVGQFGDRRPRAIYVPVSAPPALSALQSRVEAAARRAGVATEKRRYVPHVTLARFGPGGLDAGARRRLRDFHATHGDFALGPIAVDRFVLFESRLGGEASVYTPLAEFLLDPPSAPPNTPPSAPP